MLSSLKLDRRIKPDVIPGMYALHVHIYLTKQFLFFTESYSQENSQSNNDSHKETDDAQLVDTNPYSLGVGSVVQYGEPDQCGVIKWMGNLPKETEVYAGLEMVRYSYVTVPPKAGHVHTW